VPNAAAQVPDITTRLGDYLTARVYNQAVTIIAPDTTATAFPVNNGSTKLQNVTVHQISLTQAVVQWTPVAGAVGYRVFKVNSDGSTALLGRVPAMTSGQPTASITLINLPQAGILNLQVEAYNAAHTVTATAPASATLTMALAALAAPTNVTATKVVGSLSVLVSWTGSSGAAGYRVFQVSGTKKTLLATVGEGVTSTTINGLKAGTTVSFRVESFRGSQIADSALATIKLSALDKPVLTVTPLSSVSAKLDWTTVTGAKGYRVYRISPTGRKTLISTLGAGASTLTVAGVPAGSLYMVEAFAGTQIADSNIAP